MVCLELEDPSAAPGPLGLPVHSAALFTDTNLADQQFADPAGTKIPKMVPTGLHQVSALFFFFYKFIYVCIYLLRWGLCCSARASHGGGFSCCGAQALGAHVSVVVAHGLSSCGTRA